MNGIKNNREEGIKRQENKMMNGIKNNSGEGIKREDNECQDECIKEQQGRRSKKSGE